MANTYFCGIYADDEPCMECADVNCAMRILKVLGNSRTMADSITIEFPWISERITIEIHRRSIVLESPMFTQYKTNFATQLHDYAEPERSLRDGDDVFVAVTFDHTHEPMGIDQNGVRACLNDIEYMYHNTICL